MREHNPPHYDKTFFEQIEKGSLSSARAMVPHIIELFHPKSVVDVGCGTGAWLSVFRAEGVDVCGIDGDYIPRDHLFIPDDKFIVKDLNTDVVFDKKFDIVLCLEVAEHLPRQRSDSLIAFLVSMAPVVIFSAAIPGQGGTHHINEQWQTFWIELFKKKGYDVLDIFRTIHWDNKDIEPWYRQNIFAFVRQEHASRYNNQINGRVFSTVHPDIFSLRIDSIIADKDSIIADKDSIIADKDSIIADKDSIIMNYETYVDCLTHSFSWQLTKPLRYLRSRTASMRIWIEEVLNAHKKEEFPFMVDAHRLSNRIWTGTDTYICALLGALFRVENGSDFVGYYGTGHNYNNNLFPKSKNIYSKNTIDILLSPLAPQVFHRTSQCFSVLDLLSLLKAKSSVITIHDLILYKFPSYFKSQGEHETYKTLMSLSLEIVDKIIAISVHNKEDILENFNVNQEKIHVIYHGADHGLSEPERIKINKSRFSFMKDYILYVGTDYPHKNLVTLIEAYTLLHEKMQNAPLLVMAGLSISRNYRSELKKQCETISGQVIFLDYVNTDDLAYLYRHATLFVYPSIYEGFGLPILEAMSYGIPVLTSSATSIPEIAGDAAYVINCEDKYLLERSIKKMLTDEVLRSHFIARGIVQWRKFTWEKAAEETIEVYRLAYQATKNRDRSRLSPHDAKRVRQLLSVEPQYNADVGLQHKIDQLIENNLVL